MTTENRPPLDRGLVVQTALKLLSEVGLDGLSTRRLAAELGVKSPALYWHFRNKQELLDAIADTFVQQPGMGPPQPDESWQAWLMRRGRAYRAALLSYPDSARIVTSAQQLSPATVQTFNMELAALVELGFGPSQALRTITAVTNYVNGFVLREQSGLREAASAQATAAALAKLIAEGGAELLLSAFAEGGSPYSEESFEYGLQALIAGCAAALGRG